MTGFIASGVCVMSLCRYPSPKLLKPSKISFPKRHFDGERLLLISKDKDHVRGLAIGMGHLLHCCFTGDEFCQPRFDNGIILARRDPKWISVALSVGIFGLIIHWMFYGCVFRSFCLTKHFKPAKIYVAWRCSASSNSGKYTGKCLYWRRNR